jgi:predicted MFS family arabinose efflux permease
VIEMVGPEEVANAVGLNSAIFNTGRIVGPAVAAVVIKLLGLAEAFNMNAISYIAPVIALLMMDRRALHRGPRAERQKGMVREGLRYAWGHAEIRRALLVLTVVATIGFNFSVTVPLMAKFTFGKDVSAYAILTSMLAGGGLIGALWTAHRARPTQRLMAWSAALFGGFALASAFAPTLWWAAFILAITGASSMAFISTVNSTLQLQTPAPLRGRVMALYALVFLGSTPIGSPLVGWISQVTNARVGIGIGGLASFIAAVIAIATLRPDRRRVREEHVPGSAHVVVPEQPSEPATQPV